MIAKSAMDSLYTDDIEYNKENVLVIIEGLSMYLHENDIREIFSIIEKAFNKSTVMIETMSPFFVKHMKEKSIEGSNAKFSWGVKNGKDLQQIVPAFNWKRDVSLPLRYNNDKQKKPLFSRGLSVCRLLFNSFSKLKIDENYKEKRRLFY